MEFGVLWGIVLIRFTDPENKRRALESLVGAFSLKSRASGEMLAPEESLPRLAREDIPFKRHLRSRQRSVSSSATFG